MGLTFPLSLVSAISHRIMLTPGEQERRFSGSCAWTALLQQQCGQSGVYPQLLDAF